MRRRQRDDQSPHPQFKLINLVPTAIPLSDLTIRYWFTADGAATQSAAVDFATNSANAQIQAQHDLVVHAGHARRAPTHFCSSGSPRRAGTLTGNGGTAVVRARFNSLNPAFGITYTQTNDYSFDADQDHAHRLDPRRPCTGRAR